MTRIFLIDDHSFLNKGIEAVFIERDFGIKVVGTSTSGEDALKQIKTLEVDVVLLDINMPEMDGITACKLIKKQFPKIKIIAFTGELDPNKLLKMWKQGVDGILSKTCGPDDLASTVETVLLGLKVSGKGVPTFLDRIEADIGHIPKLTKTELEVLKLLGTGLSRKEVAEEMYRSQDSVNFHIKNMYKKFKTDRVHRILEEARKARFIK